MRNINDDRLKTKPLGRKTRPKTHEEIERFMESANQSYQKLVPKIIADERRNARLAVERGRDLHTN